MLYLIFWLFLYLSLIVCRTGDPHAGRAEAGGHEAAGDPGSAGRRQAPAPDLFGPSLIQGPASDELSGPPLIQRPAAAELSGPPLIQGQLPLSYMDRL